MLVIAAEETVEVRTATCAVTFAGVRQAALAAVLKSRALPVLCQLLSEMEPGEDTPRALPGCALEERLRAAGLLD